MTKKKKASPQQQPEHRWAHAELVTATDDINRQTFDENRNEIEKLRRAHAKLTARLRKRLETIEKKFSPQFQGISGQVKSRWHPIRSKNARRTSTRSIGLSRVIAARTTIRCSTAPGATSSRWTGISGTKGNRRRAGRQSVRASAGRNRRRVDRGGRTALYCPDQMAMACGRDFGGTARPGLFDIILK